ncbi:MULTISPECIES: CBS domain-containing protein [Aquirufa]|uniref:CBS domain-containing protein n=2 Tax=Aquirufa TaxID=2676247 RepID=A0ABT4JGK6_9BACT|nr:CBS domain-containing protein [Aquirufa ecclesiirivi]MCZ2472675.1 CBS domain-containing protein [Aquirufa ecclesiirivi]MCZ2475416.1 CBS domain-containing protein [Aquirufa ecclesiirivi]MDF0694218.1 CBS domain-containing protein [Aquirufa ecclesiirivi]NHC49761.1 CBS domain-containing protein [Aquirufa ecclesiirivi]
MKKVNDILSQRKRDTITVGPDTHVIEALKIMQDQNIGSVVVMEGNQYLGIMTERDYARKVILLGKSSIDASVKEIMSTDLPQINRETTLEMCMIIVSEKNIRYLPVLENGHFVGIISVNDLITATIQDHLDTIEHLKNYIQM